MSGDHSEMCACCGFERGGIGDVECYCDRSALYTLAHNLAVGAALCAAYHEGCDECGSWFPGNGDVFSGYETARTREAGEG